MEMFAAERVLCKKNECFHVDEAHYVKKVVS